MFDYPLTLVYQISLFAGTFFVDMNNLYPEVLFAGSAALPSNCDRNRTIEPSLLGSFTAFVPVCFGQKSQGVDRCPAISLVRATLVFVVSLLSLAFGTVWAGDAKWTESEQAEHEHTHTHK